MFTQICSWQNANFACQVSILNRFGMLCCCCRQIRCQSLRHVWSSARRQFVAFANLETTTFRDQHGATQTWTAMITMSSCCGHHRVSFRLISTHFDSFRLISTHFDSFRLISTHLLLHLPLAVPWRLRLLLCAIYQTSEPLQLFHSERHAKLSVVVHALLNLHSIMLHPNLNLEHFCKH